jgi:hypothetical protein
LNLSSLLDNGENERSTDMSDERPVLEMVARCVAIMVNYHNSGPRAHATREMNAEVRAVAEEVKTLSLGINGVVERVLRPVEAELFVRYGHELGARINAHFLMAFEGHGTSPKTTPAATVKVSTRPPVGC